MSLQEQCPGCLFYTKSQQSVDDHHIMLVDHLECTPRALCVSLSGECSIMKLKSKQMCRSDILQTHVLCRMRIVHRVQRHRVKGDYPSGKRCVCEIKTCWGRIFIVKSKS